MCLQKKNYIYIYIYIQRLPLDANAAIDWNVCKHFLHRRISNTWYAENKIKKQHYIKQPDWASFRLLWTFSARIASPPMNSTEDSGPARPHEPTHASRRRWNSAKPPAASRPAYRRGARDSHSEITALRCDVTVSWRRVDGTCLARSTLLGESASHTHTRMHAHARAHTVCSTVDRKTSRAAMSSETKYEKLYLLMRR